jgi:hypothetical protein
MKRFSVLIAALLLITSCTGGSSQTPDATPSISSNAFPKTEIDANTGYEDYFVYQTAGAFTVDENGIVYVAKSEYRETEEGPAIVKTITAYDMSGVMLAEYEIEVEDSISNLCVGDGVLYFTRWGENWDIAWNTQGYFSYNMETGELRKLEIPTGIFALPEAAKKLAYVDGKLYILAIHKDYVGMDCELRNEDIWGSGEHIVYRFEYEGRVLAAYDPETDTLEIIYDRLLHDFSLTPYGTIMLQAYDDIGGIYFAELNPEEMTVGERIYRDIWGPVAFATDGYGVMYSANVGALTSPPGSILYWSLGEDTGVTELVKGGGMSSSNQIGQFMYSNGFTFYIRSAETGQQLERIRNSAYITVTPPIIIINAGISAEIPREKHNIRFNTLENDAFALAVLSGGVAYDIAYVGARQDFAGSIRDRGAFYPLNDVPGVQEFLDACFPYIRDAATDVNGKIWMIPIDISVDAIIFHNENSREAGLDFAIAKTADDIIRLVRAGAEADSTNLNYKFNPYSLLSASLLKYMRKSTALDTSEFRQMAVVLKDFMTEKDYWGHTSGLPVLDTDERLNAKFLFDNVTLQTSLHYINRNDLSVVPVTGTDGTPNSANIVFLSVNPNSDKLNQTFAYITSVCEYMMNRSDKPFMFSDLSMYSEYARQLHALYKESVIDFNIPNEIFAEDFDRYLRDEISLDELIKEADRKLAMYHGE